MIDRAQVFDHSAETPETERGSIFAAKIRQLARLEVGDREAEALWQNVARHRRSLLNKLGRDVGQRVAMLDYIVNLQSNHRELRIIGKAELDSIEQQAVTDSLTGLQNRHHFDLELERETRRSRRYGMPLSLLLLDLDGFKQINDHYGHQVGDGVLRGVGSLILEHSRAADVPCRYGGDEFAIILPDTTLETACGVAHRMSAEIGAWFEQAPVLGNHVAVTATGGLASLTCDETAQQLVDHADKALYNAKRAGGARIASPIGNLDGRLKSFQ